MLAEAQKKATRYESRIRELEKLIEEGKSQVVLREEKLTNDYKNALAMLEQEILTIRQASKTSLETSQMIDELQSVILSMKAENERLHGEINNMRNQGSISMVQQSLSIDRAKRDGASALSDISEVFSDEVNKPNGNPSKRGRRASEEMDTDDDPSFKKR
jgi:hypothetical protein